MYTLDEDDVYPMSVESMVDFQIEIDFQFDRINKLCFNNELIKPYFNFSNLQIALGSFHVYSWQSLGQILEEPKISISTKHKSKEDLINTIFHEMVHYWIWHKDLPDNDTNHGHGYSFRKIYCQNIDKI